MLITVNGIGLTYYGKCDFDTDGNYISTKCFVFFYIPILPISSALINEQATTASSFREGNYAIITTFPVYWPQALRIWSFLIALMPAFIVLNHIGQFIPETDAIWYFLKTFEQDKLLALLIAYLTVLLPLPFLLRYQARRRPRQRTHKNLLKLMK